MKNNFNRTATFILATVFFTSCSSHRYLYAPSTPNTPMFNKKGETLLAASYAAGGIFKNPDKGYNRGYDLQAGYAVSKCLAVMVGLSGRFEKDIYDTSNTFHDHTTLWYTRHSTELGMGYFTPLDKEGTAYFDLYGGYGFGRYNMKEVGTGGAFNRFHNVSANKYYLQPGFHFNAGGYTQVGLYSKVSVVNYHGISTNYTATEESQYLLDGIRKNGYVYLEPSLVVRMGIPGASWLRIDLQGSTSMLMSQPTLYHRSTYLSMGLSFDFSKINDQEHLKGRGRRN